MYQLCIQRQFEAFHYLVGGDWGEENELHPHRYRVEVVLEGSQLDEHGYLVDILNLETRLQMLIDRYRGETLNALPGFQGLNPSLEHFSRILCHELSAGLKAPNIHALLLRLWESDSAWAAYRLERA